MAKKENLENETYLVEEPKQSRFSGWKSGRAAKITAVSIGSALAIGAAFTGGVVAAKTVLPHQDGPGYAEEFDRDANHGNPLIGQRPPKPGHDDRDRGRDGENRDGEQGGQFQLDPNQTSAPTPATTTP
ncbi:MAG: hypothetical protein RLY34_349 [Actinomycetota bacterium]|jgi:hypothetical protein